MKSIEMHYRRPGDKEDQLKRLEGKTVGYEFFGRSTGAELARIWADKHTFIIPVRYVRSIEVQAEDEDVKV